MSGEGNPPESITLDDAPKLNSEIEGSLKKRKSLWEKMKESAKGLDPSQLMELIKSEKAKIQKDIDKRGYVTQEEADFLNKCTREKLEKVLNDFKEKCLEHMAVHANDHPDEVKFKTNFGEQIITWLTKLFSWLLEKITEIFLWLAKQIEWCFEKAKELFTHLYNLFI